MREGGREEGRGGEMVNGSVEARQGGVLAHAYILCLPGFFFLFNPQFLQFVLLFHYFLMLLSCVVHQVRHRHHHLHSMEISINT